MDARDFAFPPGPLVVYMFNSFPAPVFAEVLENLHHSVDQNPRPVYVAYRYLEFEALLQECDWLKRVAGTEHWAVYKDRKTGDDGPMMADSGDYTISRST
jgi:hypothetical protein